MSEFQEKTEQGLGIGQNVGVVMGDIWKCIDISNGQLVATSARLKTSTLTDTIDAIKATYTNRTTDYVFTLHDITVAILHQDDTVENMP